MAQRAIQKYALALLTTGGERDMAGVGRSQGALEGWKMAEEREKATEIDLDELDLGLDLGRVGPGRQPRAIEARFLRELTAADLQMPAKVVTKAPAIAHLRDRHHALARVLATGTSEGEASVITGYSPSRISILKADPQFQELVSFYRETSTEVVADFRQRMALVGITATAILSDRLEDAPDDISTGLMNDIVKTMADRTGHAPQKGPTAQVSIHVELQDRMQRARERLAAFNGKTINHE